jgi:DNA-binding CsgD family transcriptional regulator
VLPQITLEAVGPELDARFRRVLASVRAVDLSVPEEGMLTCSRASGADFAQIVDLDAINPLGWRFEGAVGFDKLNGASRVGTICMGEHIDQGFAQGVLVPSYLQVVKAGQPVVQHISGISNGTFLSYRRLAVPFHASPQSGCVSRLAVLTFLDMAIPNMRPAAPQVDRLTPRERQCLSMSAGGLTQKQLAASLGISEKMVEMHLAHARRKLGARTTCQAVATMMATAWMSRANAEE